MPLAPPWTLTANEWLEHIWTDMSRRRRHSLTAHLLRALQHLLKWQYQPARRQTGHSWWATIRTQRQEIAELLEQSPSLPRTVPEALSARCGGAMNARAPHGSLAWNPPACVACVAALGAVVADSRFRPSSRHRAWRQAAHSRKGVVTIAKLIAKLMIASQGVPTIVRLYGLPGTIRDK